MLGAAIFAPIALIAIFQFGTDRSRAMAHSRMRGAPRAARDAAGGQVAGQLRRPEDCRARRAARPRSRQANPPLLGAAGVARCRGRRDDARGGGWATPSSIRAKSAPPSPSSTGLKRALGRSTFAALNALLPFSRNDHWEVSELRQRLALIAAERFRSLSLNSSGARPAFYREPLITAASTRDP